MCMMYVYDVCLWCLCFDFISYLMEAFFFATDHPGLSNVRQIEKFQEMAISELHDYEAQTYPSKLNRFSKLLLRLPTLRLLSPAIMEELFFAGLIGNVQIDSIIPYILRMETADYNSAQITMSASPGSLIGWRAMQEYRTRRTNGDQMWTRSWTNWQEARLTSNASWQTYLWRYLRFKHSLHQELAEPEIIKRTPRQMPDWLWLALHRAFLKFSNCDICFLCFLLFIYLWSHGERVVLYLLKCIMYIIFEYIDYDFFFLSLSLTFIVIDL